MSKSKENGEHTPADFENPEVQETPEGSGSQDNPGDAEGQGSPEAPEHSGGQDDPQNEPPEESGLVTIEELAEKLKVGKPVLAAVKQSEGWSEGKKVTEPVLKTAVETFLGAPMGGKAETPKEGEAKLPEGGEQPPPEGDKS
jgi:hypothetical protein